MTEPLKSGWLSEVLRSFGKRLPWPSLSWNATSVVLQVAIDGRAVVRFQKEPHSGLFFVFHVGILPFHRRRRDISRLAVLRDGLSVVTDDGLAILGHVLQAHSILRLTGAHRRRFLLLLDGLGSRVTVVIL